MTEVPLEPRRAAATCTAPVLKPYCGAKGEERVTETHESDGCVAHFTGAKGEERKTETFPW